jgi:hypothetical protein
MSALTAPLAYSNEPGSIVFVNDPVTYARALDQLLPRIPSLLDHSATHMLMWAHQTMHVCSTAYIQASTHLHHALSRTTALAPVHKPPSVAPTKNGLFVMVFDTFHDLTSGHPRQSAHSQARCVWIPRETLVSFRPFGSLAWTMDACDPAVAVLFLVVVYHLDSDGDDYTARMHLLAPSTYRATWDAPKEESSSSSSSSSLLSTPTPDTLVAPLYTTCPICVPDVVRVPTEQGTVTASSTRLFLCSACRWVPYCCREHQRQHYPLHKHACAHYQRLTGKKSHPFFTHPPTSTHTLSHVEKKKEVYEQ